jgi:hypothetical protein
MKTKGQELQLSQMEDLLVSLEAKVETYRYLNGHQLTVKTEGHWCWKLRG